MSWKIKEFCQRNAKCFLEKWRGLKSQGQWKLEINEWIHRILPSLETSNSQNPLWFRSSRSHHCTPPKIIHFNTSRQPRLRKFHKSFDSFHVQLDAMGKRSFPSIFNGVGDPFVNDCKKFTMQTEKYIDGGVGGL